MLVATAPIIPTSNESPVPPRSPPIVGASVRSKCRASRSSARASRCRRQDLEEVVTSQNRDSHRARSQQPVVQDGNDPPRRAAPRRGRQRHRPRRTRGPRLHHTVGRTEPSGERGKRQSCRDLSKCRQTCHAGNTAARGDRGMCRRVPFYWAITTKSEALRQVGGWSLEPQSG